VDLVAGTKLSTAVEETKRGGERRTTVEGSHEVFRKLYSQETILLSW
jgi:hypothetical protein